MTIVECFTWRLRATLHILTPFTQMISWTAVRSEYVSRQCVSSVGKVEMTVWDICGEFHASIVSEDVALR
jgi:hypothetical protein